MYLFKGWLQATFRSDFHPCKCEIMGLAAAHLNGWDHTAGPGATARSFTALYFFFVAIRACCVFRGMS